MSGTSSLTEQKAVRRTNSTKKKALGHCLQHGEVWPGGGGKGQGETEGEDSTSCPVNLCSANSQLRELR